MILFPQTVQDNLMKLGFNLKNALSAVFATSHKRIYNLDRLYFNDIPSVKFIADVLQIEIDLTNEEKNRLKICSGCHQTLNSFSNYYNMVHKAQRQPLTATFNEENALEAESEIKPIEVVKIKNKEKNLINSNQRSQVNVVKTSFVFNINNGRFIKLDNLKKPLGLQTVGLHLSFHHKSKKESYTSTISNCNKLHSNTNTSCDSLESSQSEVLKTNSATGSTTHSNSIWSTDIDSIVSQGTQNISDDRYSVTKVDGCGESEDEFLGIELKKYTCKPNTHTVESLWARQKMLGKYNRKQIFSKNKCILDKNQKDEMCELFFKMICEFCKDNRIFKNYEELTQHSQLEHNATPQVQCCCKEFVPAGDDLVTHVIQAHLFFAPKHVVCEICNKLFRGENFKGHLSRHIPAQKRRFPCDQCDAGFHDLAKLKLHIKTVHNSEKITCDICNKKYTSLYTLRSHVAKYHTEESHPLFMCEICGKVLKSEKNHKYHIDAHNNAVKKVKCSTCDAVVSEPCLRAHMRRHKKPVYKCPYCDYVSIRSVLQHVRRNHDKIRNHACSSCDMKFYNSTELREHTASRHTGIPGYSCEFCNKTFMSSGNMYCHKKRMHPQQLLEKKQQSMSNMDDVEYAKGKINTVKLDNRAISIMESLNSRNHKQIEKKE